MIATRGHDNWLSSFVHLPDFTIPALFIAGIYFRHFWVAFTLILSAIAVDNFAIIYQGISANCITPAYSVLPLTNSKRNVNLFLHCAIIINQSQKKP
jgi:hypothetical protein